MNADLISKLKAPCKSRRGLLVTAFIGIATTLGCENKISSPTAGTIVPASGSVYFNSFEAGKDTVEWRGYGGIKFMKDAPVGGGKQSLQVAGGCIWPHANFVLPAFRHDGYFIVQCWGKNLMTGGGLELNLAGDYAKSGIGISIQNPDWTFYESTDTLYCPANRNLELLLGAGGIVPSAMLVDLIQVIKVRSPDSNTTRMSRNQKIYRSRQ